MEYIQVKNWDNFQHYKDRTPPWIKLYNHLLDDFDFSCLPDASKAHLLSIWLLASRTNNKIPNNARWIGNKINATEEVNLNILIESGFIELISSKNNEIQTSEQDASKMIQTSEQDACLEREERERREYNINQFDYELVAEIWNLSCDESNTPSKKCRVVSEATKKNMPVTYKKHCAIRKAGGHEPLDRVEFCESYFPAVLNWGSSFVGKHGQHENWKMNLEHASKIGTYDKVAEWLAND